MVCCDMLIQSNRDLEVGSNTTHKVYLGVGMRNHRKDAKSGAVDGDSEERLRLRGKVRAAAMDERERGGR
jgi:hypothetical protein